MTTKQQAETLVNELRKEYTDIEIIQAVMNALKELKEEGN